MIHIDDSLIIGSGVDRTVYAHPQDGKRCIKIPKCDVINDFRITGLRDNIYYLSRRCDKRYFDFNFTDVQYAERLKKKHMTDSVFRHLPICHGFVETNLGKGVLWQRIQNFDGSDCYTLRDCSNSPGLLGEKEKDILRNALEEFFSWQIDNGIMLREMALINTLICQVKPSKYRLYHVDAIGCVDLIPLADYALWFARLRIRMKVRRFRRHVFKKLGSLN